MNRKLLVLGLSMTSLAQAMSSSVETNTLPLTKENAWLVHGTSVFPKNGVMVPGTLPPVGMGDEKFNLPESFKRVQIDLGLTGVRLTLHWSLNSLVYAHTKSSAQGAPVINKEREMLPYVVLEKLSAFADTKLHGYWQDVYHLGSHTLSEDAIILCRKGSNGESMRGTFKGTIISFEGNCRKAVEDILREKGTPTLYPDMRDESGTYIHTKLDQNILINSKEYPAQAFANMLHVDGKRLIDSNFGIVQHTICEGTEPVRMLFTISFLRKIYDAHKNYISKTCSNCPKTAKDSKKGTLSICAGCQKILYCSKQCQIDHWKSSHKYSCKQFSTLTFDDIKTLHDLFQVFLAIDFDYENEKRQFGKYNNFYITAVVKRGYDNVEKYFTSEFENLLNCSDERETELMKNYFRFGRTIFDYLYSYKDKYQKLRGNYEMDRWQGLEKYGHRIVKETSSQDESSE